MTRQRPPPPPGGVTLGDLLAAKGVPVDRTPSPPPPPEPAAAAGTPLDFGGATKLVVRRERKGRGGKTATVVEGIRLPPSALERVARELRCALGCGASVDDGRLVVQGDLAPRVADWLAAHGARRVVVGN